MDITKTPTSELIRAWAARIQTTFLPIDVIAAEALALADLAETLEAQRAAQIEQLDEAVAAAIDDAREAEPEHVAEEPIP